ncbi:MAG TPA: hypothetical protein VGD78_22345 [Chthoniobacterales bacterium]
MLAAGLWGMSWTFLCWAGFVVWGVVLLVLWTVLPFLVLRMMGQNNELIAEIRALRKAVLKSPRPFLSVAEPSLQNRPSRAGEP